MSGLEKLQPVHMSLLKTRTTYYVDCKCESEDPAHREYSSQLYKLISPSLGVTLLVNRALIDDWIEQHCNFPRNEKHSIPCPYCKGRTIKEIEEEIRQSRRRAIIPATG